MGYIEDAKFKKLRALMMERGYTRTYVAAYLGLTEQTFSLRLRGKNQFTALEIKKLSVLFNAPVAELGIFEEIEIA